MRIARIAVYIFCLAVPFAIFAQQVADANFDTKVAKPAYTKKHPKVLFDEAHNNFHTASGRYKPFADMIVSDGYTVTSNKEKFQKGTLKNYDILIIANALGADKQNAPGADGSAFTDEECDAVRDWVKAGGSLLLIADHAPFGAAAETMAKRFEIDMSKGHTADPANFDRETGNQGFLFFNNENKLLGRHFILTGRGDAEKITQVLSFTGQSLRGPASATPLLKLADTAVDITNGNTTGAGGRAQAVALDYGKGRVVVLGEAAMISAQVVTGPPAEALGKKEIKMGMNRPGTDNRQFALNILHWLSRLK